MTEREMLIFIKAGDRASFDALCRLSYPSLKAYANLFLDDFWAADVVQDSLYGLWCNRKSIPSDCNVRSYLLRSVYNRCMNYNKKEKYSRDYSNYMKSRVSSLASFYLSPDNNPVITAIFSQERSASLEKALESLTPRCAEIFRMSLFEKLSNKEISERLGISVSTVEGHKYAAIKELRELLAAEV